MTYYSLVRPGGFFYFSCTEPFDWLLLFLLFPRRSRGVPGLLQASGIFYKVKTPFSSFWAIASQGSGSIDPLFCLKLRLSLCFPSV